MCMKHPLETLVLDEEGAAMGAMEQSEAVPVQIQEAAAVVADIQVVDKARAVAEAQEL